MKERKLCFWGAVPAPRAGFLNIPTSSPMRKLPLLHVRYFRKIEPYLLRAQASLEERMHDRLYLHCVAQIVNEMTWAEFCLKHKTVNKTQRRPYFDLMLMVHSIYYCVQGISSP